MPETWLTCELGTLFELRSEKSKQIMATEYLESGDLPVIDQSERSIAGYIDDHARAYSGQLPVIVFGDHTRATKFIEFPFGAGADGTQILTPMPQMDARFLYYVVSRSSLLIGNYGYDRHLKHLRRVKTCFPISVTVQRRIAEILSTLDEAIEQTEALIAKHQQIKAGLMHGLFTRGVTPDGHLRPTREQAPDLYKESPLGWIPKEWEVVNLSSLAQFITSGSRGWAEYYNETGPLFIRIGNLTREHINFRWDSVVRVSLPKFTEGQRTAVMPNDILISITADLGIVAVANESLGEAYVNQHIALVRPAPDGLSSRFLGHFLTTAAVQNQFVRLNDSGAKAGLNLPAVGRILVACPRNDSESTQMASMIDTCDCNIESYKVELAKLRQQKNGLMHDLLTGKVRIAV